MNVHRIFDLTLMLALLVTSGGAAGIGKPLGANAQGRAYEYPDQVVRASFDFREGALGWEAGFADYSPSNGDLRLEVGLRPLPPELAVDGTGFYIQGVNRSDDLFMFLKRRLGPEEGVRPNQTYRVVFNLTFASNAPSDCIGVGGAPGESVYLKAGASPIEPISVLDEEENHYRMNVDKGNQGIGGPAASVIGNIANGIPCDEVADLEHALYVSLTRRHVHPLAITASADGALWLLVGTDSGFESLTALYYQRVEVLLIPISDDRSLATLELPTPWSCNFDAPTRPSTRDRESQKGCCLRSPASPCARAW